MRVSWSDPPHHAVIVHLSLLAGPCKPEGVRSGDDDCNLTTGYEVDDRMLGLKINERVKKPRLRPLFMLILHVPTSVAASGPRFDLNRSCDFKLTIWVGLVDDDVNQ